LKIPNLAITFILITAIVAIIMSKTKFGRYVYAVGSNENAARLTGINIDRIKIMYFSVTGLLTGISAFLLSSRLTSITVGYPLNLMPLQQLPLEEQQ